jgi:beta-lactamase regulating signal transducer with metallopeptidase domain
MKREHAGGRRAGGLLGSLVIHVVLVGAVLSLGPQVRDFVWEGATDGATGGGRPSNAALLGTSQVGAAPSQPTRLQQLGVAMSSNAPPAPTVRVRLAIERVLDHLWQSTVFTVVVALLALVLRRNRARVRYALWLAASVKFVVPMALVIALGRLVSPSAVDRLAAHPVLAGIREPLASLSMPALWPASAALDPARHDSSGLALAVAWLCGVAVIAALRWRQWRRLKAVVDTGEPLELAGIDIPASVAVRSATGLMEPGVVGWQQPVLLMPADIDRLLTPTEVEAIVAHELCHVRRFDNLTGAIHMIVEALFWFHPLVWWIGGRLITERERACDEHVLRTVGHPVSYAKSIVTICKRYAQAPLACVSGVSTSTVGQRIEAILANQVGERIGPWKRIVVGATMLLVMVVPPSVGAMNAPWLPGMPGQGVAMASAAPMVRVGATPPAAPTITLALVMARAGGKPGPQLRRSVRTDCDGAPKPHPCGGRAMPGRISADGVTSSELAALVASTLDYAIVDRTGLAGRFDVRLTWTPAGPTGSSLIAELDQQLGLKLVPVRE